MIKLLTIITLVGTGLEDERFMQLEDNLERLGDVVVRLKCRLLKPGMSKKSVERVLGIQSVPPTVFIRTAASKIVVFKIKNGSELWISYSNGETEQLQEVCIKCLLHELSVTKYHSIELLLDEIFAFTHQALRCALISKSSRMSCYFEQAVLPIFFGDNAEQQSKRIIDPLGCVTTCKRVANVNRVVEVYFTKCSDKEIKYITTFKQLTSIDLAGSRVTDAGLEELSSLKRLKSLDLGEFRGLSPLSGFNIGRSRISDLGVKHLSKFPELEQLVLSGKKITDMGLKELANLKNLRNLKLENTGITERGMTRLWELKQLESLDISGAVITNLNLTNVVVPESLQYLNLSRTSLTDRGLKNLSQLKLLANLNIARTRITDAALVEICRLKGLEILDLSGTEISEVGVKLLGNCPKLRYLHPTFRECP